MSNAHVRFGPREARGWLLGMTTSQLLLCVVAGYTATKIFDAEISATVRLAWIALATICLTVAFVPVRGRNVIEYVPVVANYWAQRLTGHDVYRGGPFRLADEPDAGRLVLPGDLAHLELITFTIDGSDSELAVVKDPRAKTFTAVLALEGSTFALLETSVRGARVEAWGSLLTQLCSQNAVITRIQVLERTAPDSGEGLTRDWTRRGVHDGSLQAANYEQLLVAVDGSTQTHECFVAVTVDARRAGSEIRQAGGSHLGAAAVVARELDKVAEGLRAAGVRVEGWCSPRLLGEVIRTAYDPAARSLVQRRGGADSDFRGGDDGLPSGVDPQICGPMRAENNWSYYRTDSAVHRCWWILQWPRQQVEAGFLAPLLLSSQHRRTVSLIFEPLSPTRANRRVAVKQSGVLSESSLRQRFRRRTTRRHEVEATDIDRRESELVAGYGMYRLLGLVSVSAEDQAELEAASGEIESLAQRSNLEVARLSGEHDQAFGAAALPLATGLR